MSQVEMESKPASYSPRCSGLGCEHCSYLLGVAPSHQRGPRPAVCVHSANSRGCCPSPAGSTMPRNRARLRQASGFTESQAAFVCISSSFRLHNNLRRSSEPRLLASHHTKGKLRLGELGQRSRSQNAGDLVLGSPGHSRKDCTVRWHAIAHTGPCPCSGKQLCQVGATRKRGPFPLGISEPGVGWLVREASRMMFKNKWLLTKWGKVCLSAGLLVRTTDLGTYTIFLMLPFLAHVIKK